MAEVWLRSLIEFHEPCWFLNRDLILGIACARWLECPGRSDTRGDFLEGPRRDRLGQGHGGVPSGRRGGGRFVGATRELASLHAAEPSQVVADLIEAMSRDELHGVVMDTLVFPHSVDRHDVAVVKTGGRAGLELEPRDLRGAETPRERKDLERDVPAERFLHGLINDAHPAACHLAQDSEIAEAPPRHVRLNGPDPNRRFIADRRFVARRLDSFHHQQRGKEVHDGLRQLGMLASVLGDRGTLAAPLSFDKFLGKYLQRVPVGLGARVGLRHARPPRCVRPVFQVRAP
jgi:hypothetical protein